MAVIHCAAHVEEWGPWEDYWRMNVDGTKQLLAVAKEAGVKRFVHIGTEAALFHGQAMLNVDETYPLSLNSPYPYSRTKAHAEKAVREANDGEEALRAWLQNLIDDAYGQFVQAVADGRKMTVEEVKPLADGRIYSGRQALDLKLVDAVGDSFDATKLAAELGGIKDEKPRVRRDAEKFSEIFELLESRARLALGFGPGGVTIAPVSSARSGLIRRAVLRFDPQLDKQGFLKQARVRELGGEVLDGSTDGSNLLVGRLDVAGHDVAPGKLPFDP